MLDGDIIVPADGEAITMRRRIARDGLVVVTLARSGAVGVHGVGLPLDEDYEAFVAEAQADALRAIRDLKGPAGREQGAITEAARLAVRRAATRWSGKRPQIRVLTVG